ncbi:hypothetical protein ABT298_00165 [Streptomyces sp. NPDC001034]
MTFALAVVQAMQEMATIVALVTVVPARAGAVWWRGAVFSPVRMV